MEIENPNRKTINDLYKTLPRIVKEMVDRAVHSIVNAKEAGKKVAVVVGSGPNIHEGVTTLIAELIKKGIIDGVTTSSAVIAHEMAGTLDKVKRINGIGLGIPKDKLPRGGIFEITEMSKTELHELSKEMSIDLWLIKEAIRLNGKTIIKAAGNMAYPMGLRTERLAKEILTIAKLEELSFENVVGRGADSRTIIGAAKKKNIPCIVTVPQLIGGGMVGMALADSIPLLERSTKIANLISSADVIIESAISLTQEIHDGPFETYTGHGFWSYWEGHSTYSLAEKTLIRIDLDRNLKTICDFERRAGKVQSAINDGMPKTKLMNIPFRMEMSGFARLENSIPIISDIGVVWPIIACFVEQLLGVNLDFMSYPQKSKEGEQMREWIVDNIKPINKNRLYE